MAQIAPEILLTGAIWATHRGNLGHLKMLSWDTKNHLNNDKISQIMYIKLSISTQNSQINSVVDKYLNFLWPAQITPMIWTF